MNRIKKDQLFALGLLMLASSPAWGAIKVVTTLPDLAYAVKEIGKDKVEVASLLKGTENPHYADAVPEFIRQAANADVVCLVGLELEVGWLPKVLSRSGNAQVQPGGKGYCDLGRKVTVLDKPTGAVDRSMGDVHPLGNPHFWLSPVAFAEGASAIVEVLSQVDEKNAAFYAQNYGDFQKKLQKLVDQNKAKLKPALAKLKGPALVEYHREFTYFLDTYGLKSWGSIEEKPGIPPSAGRIASVAASTKAAGVKLALAAEYSPKGVLTKFKEISGLPVLAEQTSIQPQGKIKDYSELQNSIVDGIVKILQAGAP